MPDLGSGAVADWMAANGSNDLAGLYKPPENEPAGLAGATIAFGSALDAALLPSPDALEDALEATDLAADLSAAMGHFGFDRRLRLLHWLTEAGFTDPLRIIERVTDPTTPSGAKLQTWIAALLRRELLTRLFDKDRIKALRIACETAGQPKEEPSA